MPYFYDNLLMQSKNGGVAPPTPQPPVPTDFPSRVRRDLESNLIEVTATRYRNSAILITDPTTLGLTPGEAVQLNSWGNTSSPYAHFLNIQYSDLSPTYNQGTNAAQREQRNRDFGLSQWNRVRINDPIGDRQIDHFAIFELFIQHGSRTARAPASPEHFVYTFEMGDEHLALPTWPASGTDGLGENDIDMYVDYYFWEMLDGTKWLSVGWAIGVTHGASADSRFFDHVNPWFGGALPWHANTTEFPRPTSPAVGWRPDIGLFGQGGLRVQPYQTILGLHRDLGASLDFTYTDLYNQPSTSHPNIIGAAHDFPDAYDALEFGALQNTLEQAITNNTNVGLAIALHQ